MRKLSIAVVVLTLLASACIGGTSDERTVLVDYSHDEFASFMLANFPKAVTVAQGGSIVFKQIWTGEPHTVTGGKLVDEMFEENGTWLEFFDAFDTLFASGAEIPDVEDPPDVPASELFDALRKAGEAGQPVIDAYEKLIDEGKDLTPIADTGDERLPAFVEHVEKISETVFESETLPWGIDETKDGEAFVTQNAGQPCYLTEGGPPEEGDEACDEEEQDQPVFDGTATYYNSGIIPYEGPQGNTFQVDLADDIAPGDYNFYCAVHGPLQRTKVNVVTKGTKIPSQEEVNRVARREISTIAKPMLTAFRDAQDNELNLFGEKVEGPFAGVASQAHGSINEFVPKQLTVRRNEAVTWKLMGSDHTITFDPPEYFPIIRFASEGEVSLNPRLMAPAGGSPKLPATPPGPPGTGPPLEIDGGTYDGDGFFSSGLFGGEPFATYTLKFSEAGTYRYACLLHPPMVGTVTVR